MSKQTYQVLTGLNFDVFSLRQQDKAVGKDRRALVAVTQRAALGWRGRSSWWMGCGTRGQ